jgi:hypothetical protein
MRFLALLVFATVGLNVANADVLKSEAEIRPFADSVMAKVGAGDVSGAFALMKPYTIIPSSEFEATASNSKAQRELVGTRFGSAAGYEFVDQAKVGQSLLRLTYIEKTQRHALPWMFYFYRSPEGWVLNSFLWNDNMPGLFGGAR